MTADPQVMSQEPAVAQAASTTTRMRVEGMDCAGCATKIENALRQMPGVMEVDEYHEPPEELSREIRTFARMITSLIEEAEAISWYEQRMSFEKDKDAKAIMENAQEEEFKHFGMNLEFFLRKKADWRTEPQGILFSKGDIVKRAEAAEKKAD